MPTLPSFLILNSSVFDEFATRKAVPVLGLLPRMSTRVLGAGISDTLPIRCVPALDVLIRMPSIVELPADE